MTAVDLYLMEHRFDVAHEGYSFHSESTQHPSEIVGVVWTLQKLLIEGEAVIQSAAVKDCYT